MSSTKAITFMACAVFCGFFNSVAYAQTMTPLNESTLPKLPNGCNVSLPKVINNTCKNMGQLDTVVMNTPAICKQYGLTDKAKQALEQCNPGNLVTNMWKFRLGLESKFPELFAKAINTSAKREMVDASDTPPITTAAEAFRLSILACGRDAECNKKLYNSIAEDVQLALDKTPYFCDYSKDKILDFNDTAYKNIFFDSRYPNGISHPMCKKYYCKYKECKDINDGDNDTPFILGDRFIPQYDYIYKAIQP